jgi:DNA-binding CsgD family transcriptional regulator
VVVIPAVSEQPDARNFVGTADGFGAIVGRDAELALIDGLLDEVLARNAGAVLTVGEAGAGRTRLLAEGARVAAERGIRVARAACLPLTTLLPFDPLFALLRALGDPIGTVVSRPPRELFAVVVERLQAACQDSPLLLCLDDLQSCDAASVEVIRYFLDRLSDVPIAWLLTARTDHDEAGPVAHLARQTAIKRIELRAFSPTETRALCAAMLGVDRATEELARLVYDRTGGVPFLCVELLQAVAPRDCSGVPAETVPSSEYASFVPASVSAAIQERAARLSPSARAALDWAAVLAAPFSAEELEAVSGSPPAGAFAELVEAGFIAGNARDGWSMAHSLVRDAIYARQSQHDRARRHGVIVNTLPAMPLARQALQLAGARRWGEAAGAYLSLGESALDRGWQGEDAADLFARAEELAIRGDDLSLARAARAGRVLSLLRVDTGQQALNGAAAVREELRLAGTAEERLVFLSRYARALVFSHQAADLDVARTVLDEAQALIEGADGVLLAEALEARAFLAIQAADAAAALPDAERAAELALDHGDVAIEARALSLLGIAVVRSRGAVEGRTILERALERATVAELPAQVALSHFGLAMCSEALGDLSSCREHVHEGLRQQGVPPWTVTLLRLQLALAFAADGDLDGALAHALAAERVARRGGSRSQTRAAHVLSHLHLLRGDLAEARRLLETYEAASGSEEELQANRWWGSLLEEEGALAEAMARFRRGARLGDLHSIRCLAGLVRTATARDDLAAARTARSTLGTLVHKWPSAKSRWYEANGWIAAHERRIDDACAAFLHAADACPCAYRAARLRLHAGRLASDRDQVRHAIDTFDQIQARRDGDRARAVARQLGMRPGRRRNRSGVLSAREQEVAQLIAAGHTNTEIAAMLSLSPRTVERHVSNILMKLGFRSRVNVAIEAAAGRLVS